MNTRITRIFSWIGIVATILILTACEPDRGDYLAGKWLLKRVVYTDGTAHAVDTVWYNFQSTLFMYQLYEPNNNTYRYIYGLKTWEDDTRIRLELKSSPVAVESFLPLTDWESESRSFSVDKCSGGELILRSEETSYFFRKF
ncbi:lipocalin-like domain-containing protein [Parabacteroides sp. PF5-6]|uniref:lipocalin-like domain-containing protein n=1 Tax=Parabacteroides sp. PF5-6 TaxID=1742403 RepID=UPI0024059CCF|nr:lipocalin-like domain-containing protein [Parabacteroides sp. PF5-6]MDF9829522.1 hypothetical protein [Parabacteroides sp. PF5-6]